jgi:hypothetical protein
VTSSFIGGKTPSVRTANPDEEDPVADMVHKSKTLASKQLHDLEKNYRKYRGRLEAYFKNATD